MKCPFKHELYVKQGGDSGFKTTSQLRRRSLRIKVVSSSCSGKVDESCFYITPDELNANSISDIQTFKSLYQLSFHRRLEEADPGPFF